MSEKNTIGRLKAFTTYADPELRDENDNTVAVLAGRHAMEARRLAACWNALQHIPTVELESGQLQNMVTLKRDAEAERDALAAKLAELEGQEPVAWVEIVNTHEGPYNFKGMALLGRGTHYLYASPVPALPAHVFRELVNDLRDIARTWHGSDQLRERISGRLRDDVSPTGVIQPPAKGD